MTKGKIFEGKARTAYKSDRWFLRKSKEKAENTCSERYVSEVRTITLSEEITSEYGHQQPTSSSKSAIPKVTADKTNFTQPSSMPGNNKDIV